MQFIRQDPYDSGAAAAPIKPPGTTSSGTTSFSGLPQIPTASAPPPLDQGQLLAMVKDDPAYIAFQAGSTQSRAAAQAARQQSLRGLVTNYGGVSPGFSDAFGDIDPATLQAAKENQYSFTNRLTKQYGEGVEAFKRSLAARGALQSGDLQYGLDQADYQRGQSLSDLNSQFSQSAQAAIQAYQQNEAFLAQQEAQALMAAEQSAAQWYYANWQPPTTTGYPVGGTYVPGSQINQSQGTPAGTPIRQVDTAPPYYDSGLAAASLAAQKAASRRAGIPGF